MGWMGWVLGIIGLSLISADHARSQYSLWGGKQDLGVCCYDTHTSASSALPYKPVECFLLPESQTFFKNVCLWMKPMNILCYPTAAFLHQESTQTEQQSFEASIQCVVTTVIKCLFFYCFFN